MHASRTDGGWRVRWAPARVRCWERPGDLVLSFLLSLLSTRDRPATTLLYDINPPRYDGVGRRHLRPRQNRQHRALRLSCRKAKVLASACPMQRDSHTRCTAAPHLHPHLTLHAPRALELLGVTGAPSASCQRANVTVAVVPTKPASLALCGPRPWIIVKLRPNTRRLATW
jgi:hypothetical protein